MADLDPFAQPRVPLLPALVEALPAHAAPAAPATQATPPEGLFTRERQVVFLHALAATGAVRAAAGRAGVSHQTAYRARLADALFRRAWDAALLAARVHAEDVLSCRAIDGVEEEVMYHGEVVATRRRFDSRLLLAHLARLDRLTADVRVEAFAGDFEAALDRFAAGSETPEQAPPPAKKKKTPGEWSKRSKTEGRSKGIARSGGAGRAAVKDCAECGGKCNGPEAELSEADCRWLGHRLARMEAARPPGTKKPHEFAGYAMGTVETQQLAAFEAEEDEWWRVVPAGPGEDPGDWHFAA